MHSTAIQTENISKAHTRPLRILHTTIAALIVSRHCLDNGLVGSGHLHHGGKIVLWVKIKLTKGKAV
jgi:hypothetical protein